MKKIMLILSVSLFFYNCSETEVLDETGRMEVTDFNLPELPENYHYEGWLLVDGSYVSVGQITNDSIQNNRARFDEIEVTDLATAQSFAITVEASGSAAPSNYVLILGDFNGNSATLTSDAQVSNGVMGLAKRISASYTVQNASVPSEDQGNYGVNGIWFFKGTDDTMETTIQLEYGDIDYQAWLTKTGSDGLEYDLNMGVIENDTIGDNSRIFIPSAYASNIPDFSGEDFLQLPSANAGSFPEGFFPVDVRGAKLILTPIPNGYNNVTVPFPISILETTVPNDAVKDPNLVRDFQINTNFGATATKL
ncbi:anti-sigma factor [Moheibacter lacus]|uniref:Anti-sigma factor n=1 Tax=Moheibacter lacus TaxID=2745851 RepID=A0A838ZFM8_9FLAO|nr:anti-sigma factor [Moheibacter lacus]MBA5628531.1 anti-sigma factor [Moheibacter lacus]